jgi:hypothetical protein
MSILEAIKKTVKYEERYGYKLTKNQLFERLIGDKVYSKKEISKYIKQTLRSDFIETTSLDREASMVGGVLVGNVGNNGFGK